MEYDFGQLKNGRYVSVLGEADMDKIILHGTGKMFYKVCNIIEQNPDIEVMEVWDTDLKKVGQVVSINKKKFQVLYPHKLEINVPVVITSTRYENEIRKELIESFHIKKDLIKEWLYCAKNVKEEILKRYNKFIDYQLKEELEHIRKHGLHIFNNGLYEKYRDFADSISVYWDKNRECWYSMWNEKKLYLKRSMNKMEAKQYLCGIYCEQDIQSPHSYAQAGLLPCSSQVIIDAGAAEGFFSLELVEHAKRIYINEQAGIVLSEFPM